MSRYAPGRTDVPAGLVGADSAKVLRVWVTDDAGSTVREQFNTVTAIEGTH